ncbi:WecB/TagA/CpsF family glycosyltransferase [Terrisporobacter sp.]|uniref:WecB/TagA/CpsF family glycosyltransferase n=1 Tax=Terrisporobacter sp. TaxID=1965305 RepID=UPI002622F50F|nr:WecB/TagA/CpsF family glycosyltransferase [Terrisporobacter sp.]
MYRIELFNIGIDNVTMYESIDVIDRLVIENKNAYVVTPNVDHIVKVQKDPEFMRIYKEADLVLADGIPVVWASKLLKKGLSEKVSGSDLFPLLCERASQKGYKVFLLGAREGVAKRAADELISKYPGLDVVGTYSPKFGFEKDEKENNKIIEMLQNAKPDILFVGVGAPKQEKWIYNNKDKINVPVSLGIGASFDFVAGSVKRAPLWMQKSGLEWFYRFLQEPKRMFRRYFIEDIKFLGLIIKELKR